MKNNIKKIFDSDKVILLFIFIVGLLISIPFIIPSYNMDGYCQLSSSYSRYAILFASAGRFITFVLWEFFGIIHISHDFLSIISYLFSVLFLSLSSFEIYKFIYKKYEKKLDLIKKFFLLLGSFMITFNPMVQELFIYEESFVMCLSIYLCVLSAKNVFKKTWKDYLISLVLLVLANWCYQGMLCMFIPTVLLFSFFDDPEINLWKFIKNNIIFYIIICFVYGISLIIGFLSIKFFVLVTGIASAKLGEVSLIGNIKYILKSLFNVFNVYFYQINPKACNLFLIIFFSVLLLLTISYRKKYLTYLVFCMVLFIACFTLGYVPNLVSETAGNYTPARIVPSLGATFGFLSIMSILFFDNKGELRIIIKNIYLIIVCFFFLFNCYNFFKLSYISYKRYKSDIAEMSEVVDDIKKYEDKNDITVTKVKFTMSPYVKSNYNIYNINSKRLFSCDWGFSCELKHQLNNRNIKWLQMSDSEYEKYYGYLDDETVNKYVIKFNKNVAYIYIY